MDEQDDSGSLFGLDGSRDPVAGPPEEGAEPRSDRRRWIALGLGVTAAAVAVVIAITSAAAAPTRPETSTSAAPTPTVTTTSSPRTTVAAPKAPSPSAQTRSEAGPAAQRELASVAAGLPAVSLTSPAAWDQWLPEGKPFPGADLEDDLSTCPVLSDRLGQVTGQRMSYWTGTLPGPMGCAWAETPLDYDFADYDYVVSVGFLADGSTDWFPIGSCARLDVPAVADGAVLGRCEWQGYATYVLAVPDTRLAEGLWILNVQTKAGAQVPPSAVLPALVDGVVAAFG
jgi:hypothetical protein